MPKQILPIKKYTIGDEVVIRSDGRFVIGFLTSIPEKHTRGWRVFLETRPAYGGNLAKPMYVSTSAPRLVAFERDEKMQVALENYYVDDTFVSESGEVMYNLRSLDGEASKIVSEEYLLGVLKNHSTPTPSEVLPKKKNEVKKVIPRRPTVTFFRTVAEASQSEVAEVVRVAYLVAVGEATVNQLTDELQTLFDGWSSVYAQPELFSVEMLGRVREAMLTRFRALLRGALLAGFAPDQITWQTVAPRSLRSDFARQAFTASLVLASPKVTFQTVPAIFPDLPLPLFNKEALTQCLSAVVEQFPTFFQSSASRRLETYYDWLQELERVFAEDDVTSQAFEKTSPAVLRSLGWLSGAYASSSRSVMIPGHFVVATLLGATGLPVLGREEVKMEKKEAVRDEAHSEISNETVVVVETVLEDDEDEAVDAVVLEKASTEVNREQSTTGMLERFYDDGVFVQLTYTISGEAGETSIGFAPGSLVVGFEAGDYLETSFLVPPGSTPRAIWAEAASRELERLYIYSRLLEEFDPETAVFSSILSVFKATLSAFIRQFGEEALRRVPGDKFLSS